MEPLLVKVCAMEVPVPFEAPVTPVCKTVQSYVVPVILEAGIMFVVASLQMVVPVPRVATGNGLTVKAIFVCDAVPQASVVFAYMVWGPGVNAAPVVMLLPVPSDGVPEAL